jgi:cytochrome bd ubiquinol oxidase subunit II
VAFANIVRGVPLDARHEYTGGLGGLLNPYALLGGLTLLTVFALHGAVFLALKTAGEIRERAAALAARIGMVAGPLAVGFLAWTLLGQRRSAAAVALAVLAAVALVLGLVATGAGREGWAFTGTAVSIAFTVSCLFAALFPDVLPSTAEPAGTLTTANASATPYTLKIMTWAAAVFAPIVLLYQGWTYWVFRRRIGASNIPD